MSHDYRDDIPTGEAMKEEPRIEMPEVKTVTYPDGRVVKMFSCPLSPKEKEAWSKKIHERFPDSCVDNIDNWTERTQNRLNELIKKLEV